MSGKRDLEHENTKDFEKLAAEAGVDAKKMIHVLADSELSELSVDVDDVKAQVENRDDISLVRFAYLYMQGYTNGDLASAFSLNISTINDIKRSQEFKDILEMLGKEAVASARTFLSASSIKAVRTLVSCMNSKDERVRMQAAQDVLNRLGVKAAENVNVNMKKDGLSDMTDEELQAFLQAGMTDTFKKKAVEVTHEPVE